MIEIINKLGHCISFPLVCDIETGIAQSVQVQSTQTSILPVKPSNEKETIVTTFWVDNFDVIIDSINGGGAVNTTHMVAFQEMQPEAGITRLYTSVPRTKSRSLNVEEQEVRPLTIDVKKEPPFFGQFQTWTTCKDDHFLSIYMDWITLRKQNAFDQIIPAFSGWRIKLRKNTAKPLKKTVECYLPPITTKVTDFKTIHNYMEYCRKLSTDVNMPYVNKTLDVGAAINAYKYLWNNVDEFNNIIIHLGDFHFMKENFKVIFT